MKLNQKRISKIFSFFFDYKKNSNQKPISSIQVELTNHCNYKCLFCPQSQWRLPQYSEVPYERPKGFMDFDLFCKVVDEAGQISNEINFSFFGEPMIHPEFLKFMDYLKGRKSSLRVVMNTNLSLATREIYQKLIDINLSDLRISLDAATSKIYKIVRPGMYYIDLDGIIQKGNGFETICKKAEYWFSLLNHRPTRHVFTVNSKNVAEAEMFVRRWLPLLGDNDIILTKNVLTYGGKISDRMIFRNPCNVWDIKMLTVDWTGRVTPCNLDNNMDLTIGSVLESNLLELYLSEKYKQIEYQSKSRQITPCRTCIDGNNWSRNLVFHKGDILNENCFNIYQDDKFLDNS